MGVIIALQPFLAILQWLTAYEAVGWLVRVWLIGQTFYYFEFRS